MVEVKDVPDQRVERLIQKGVLDTGQRGRSKLRHIALVGGNRADKRVFMRMDETPT